MNILFFIQHYIMSFPISLGISKYPSTQLLIGPALPFLFCKDRIICKQYCT